MGHDIFVYGCDDEPIVPCVDGYELAYARFGAGCPLRDVWYQTFEATEFDNICSGNGDSKTFGRLEFKAYRARYGRLRPECFEQPRVKEWLREIDADKSQVAWLVDQVDAAMTSIQNFFDEQQPQISSGVAIFLKHTEFPSEVTRNIGAFAADDDARVWMRFG